MSEQPTPSAHPDRELLVRIVEERFAPMSFSVNRKRISDRAFRTSEHVRMLTCSLLEKGGFEYLRGNFLVPLEQDGVSQQIEIPKIAVLSLGTSAIVARDWEKMQGDVDTRTGNVFEELVSNIEEAPTTEDLVRKYPQWTGPIRALVQDVLESGGATEQYASGIRPEALASDQSFIVDALPPGNDKEQFHLNASGMVQRLGELTGSERKQVSLGWRQWKDDVFEATNDHVGAMLDVYSKVRIDPEDLMNLVSGPVRTRSETHKRLQRGTKWFLEDPDEDVLRDMLAHGTASVLYNKEHTSVIGYCGALTETDIVREYMQRHYGYRPKQTYSVSDDLPRKAYPHGSRGGETEVHWLDDQFACYILNNIDSLAVSVEIAVSDTENLGQESRKTSGAATALKLHNYRQAILRGKTSILLRHLEILRVNHVPVVPAAVNRPGRLFIEVLDGHQVGYHRETAKRADGIEVFVNWHDYVANLAEVIRIIEAKVA